MLDRTKAVHRDAQLDAALQRVGDERDVLQIGQERALGLVVGVGNIVAHQPALAGQLANPRHFNLFLEWEPKASRKGGADSGMNGIRQPPPPCPLSSGLARPSRKMRQRKPARDRCGEATNLPFLSLTDEPG